MGKKKNKEVKVIIKILLNIIISTKISSFKLQEDHFLSSLQLVGVKFNTEKKPRHETNHNTQGNIFPYLYPKIIDVSSS